MQADLRLQQDVMAEPRWEPAAHAAQFGVETKVKLSAFGKRTDADIAGSARNRDAARDTRFKPGAKPR
jgi:hypothetical protein